MEPTPYWVTCAFVICARSAWIVWAAFSSSVICPRRLFARSMHAWVGKPAPGLGPPVGLAEPAMPPTPVTPIAPPAPVIPDPELHETNNPSDATAAKVTKEKRIRRG